VTAILERSLGIKSIVAFDLNPARVLEAAVSGLPAVYGDGSSPKLLESSGVVSPRAIVITYANLERRLQAVEQLHAAYPGVPILARARSEQEREKLLEAGAQIVLAEFSEVSCQLASTLATEVYSKSIDTDEARRQLQLAGARKFAAGPAGPNDEELEQDLPEDLDVDMIVMDSGLPRSEVLRLHRIFRSIDLDGSGEADFDEVRQLLARSASSAVSDGQFQEWMEQLDADGSGTVDFEEFLAVYRGKEPA
jgi:voltage-gated potassium channel Kch